MSFKFSAALVVAGVVLAAPLGTAATTCNSVAACVLGNNTGSGVGLEGVSQLNVALYGVSTANHGIDGRSRQSYGVVGYTFANGASEASGRAGVYGIDSGTGQYNYGVIGKSTNGSGIAGSGMTGVTAFGTGYGMISEGDFIGGLFSNNNSTEPSTLLLNLSGGPVLQGGVQNGDAFEEVVSIDGAGNEILAGRLTESGTPTFRTKTQGSDVASYGARTAAPTLEDFGTAQLRNGATFVSLDRTFASAIDARSYLVFVTPHGNSNGLYAETSPTGFTVRENNSGRSTVASIIASWRNRSTLLRLTFRQWHRRTGRRFGACYRSFRSCARVAVGACAGGHDSILRAVRRYSEEYCGFFVVQEPVYSLRMHRPLTAII